MTLAGFSHKSTIMSGRNGKTTMRELRVVAEEKNFQDSLKLLVEIAMKQEYDKKW